MHLTHSCLYFFTLSSGEALATTLSALYGKLLVVMGIAFPMAEVISTYIPPSFYEVRPFRRCFFLADNSPLRNTLPDSVCFQGFYLYLYIGSMVFLLFMYTTLLWGKPKMPPVSPIKSKYRFALNTLR